MLDRLIVPHCDLTGVVGVVTAGPGSVPVLQLLATSQEPLAVLIQESVVGWASTVCWMVALLVAKLGSPRYFASID